MAGLVVEIVADTSEARSRIPDILAARAGTRLTLSDMDVGDYLIGPDALVERKSAEDFVASIMDRRLFAQVEMLRATASYAAVLIEGDIYATRSMIATDALEAATSWIATVAQLPVLWSRNPAQSASILHTMARHVQHGLGYTPPMRTGKPTAATVVTRFILEGVPGVGASTALALARHFGSVQAVSNADVAELQRVPGIGAKVAERIYAALRSG